MKRPSCNTNEMRGSLSGATLMLGGGAGSAGPVGHCQRRLLSLPSQVLLLAWAGASRDAPALFWVTTVTAPYNGGGMLSGLLGRGGTACYRGPLSFTCRRTGSAA